MSHMIRIIALTEAGNKLAETIKIGLNAKQKASEVWFKPKPFAEKIQHAFIEKSPLIFICATGIVVRTLAPVLLSKHEDPPVLVIDEQGEFVIPLLSGHEGGANDWANEIATLLHAKSVVTTAKAYVNPIYTVGMGCERGCPADELHALLQSCLAQAGLTLDHISNINSINIKADEAGLLALASTLNKPYQTFDTTQLSTVENLLNTKSDYIYSVVGVYGVAESAALYAAKIATQELAELVLTKQKTAKATCAIARSYPKVCHASRIEENNRHE